jgi:hypothetical protein
LALLAACARPHAKTPSGPRELDHASPTVRAKLLRSAMVWRPTRIPEMDLYRGPQAKDGFEPDQEVTCDYVTPDKRPSGHTPKFLCDLGDGDAVKVKYNSNEVYAEVAASRLLWAIGFGADRDYPVRVTCRRCPIDPWYWSTERKVDEKQFVTASIQRRLEGKTIEVKDDGGWAWSELERVDKRAGGAPTAQRDALKLLAVFLQHSDSKAGNQILLCPKDEVVKDAAGNEDCKKALMYVHDVGVTFGKATLLNNSRVDLQAWRSEPVWKDAHRCIANQKKSLTGTLKDPRISEGGRKFLADLLGQLSDKQILDMFRAARLDRLEDKIQTPEGERRVTLDDWVEVFKKKRDEIAKQRCPK